MNLQENIERIKQMMGLLVEQKSKKDYPIILIGPQGSGKSTTAKSLSKKLKIPLVQTDMLMINKKYESACKDEPGVEVEIKRHPEKGTYYSSNDKYPFCVLNKIMDEYGDKNVVIDVGGTHAFINKELSSKVKKLLNKTPNIFIFSVSDDENETYDFLKKRRKERGEKTTSKKDEEKVKDTIKSLEKYYKDTNKITITNSDNTEKTTNELVDEIIKNIN